MLPILLLLLLTITQSITHVDAKNPLVARLLARRSITLKSEGEGTEPTDSTDNLPSNEMPPPTWDIWWYEFMETEYFLPVIIVGGCLLVGVTALIIFACYKYKCCCKCCCKCCTTTPTPSFEIRYVDPLSADQTILESGGESANVTTAEKPSKCGCKLAKGSNTKCGCSAAKGIPAPLKCGCSLAKGGGTTDKCGCNKNETTKCGCGLAKSGGAKCGCNAAKTFRPMSQAELEMYASSSLHASTAFDAPTQSLKPNDAQLYLQSVV
jgi:hypothetical protein